MTTVSQVAKILGVMMHAYPRFELSTDTIRLYGQLLSDIPVDVLEAAAHQIMAESKFFPTIAEFREMSHSLMTGKRNIPSAYEAWENAMSEINRCGDYYRYQVQTRIPEYSHQLVEKAVSIIGYRNLMESDNKVADRAHFFKIYESLLDRAQDEVRLLPEVKKVSDKYLVGVKLLTGKLTVRED